jgi:hypothetical protein
MESEVVDRVAEAIFQAEWSLAGNKGMRTPAWRSVEDKSHFRFLARQALLTYINLKLSEVS